MWLRFLRGLPLGRTFEHDRGQVLEAVVLSSRAAPDTLRDDVSRDLPLKLPSFIPQPRLEPFVDRFDPGVDVFDGVVEEERVFQLGRNILIALLHERWSSSSVVA